MQKTINNPDQEELLKKVASLLSKADIPYMVTGSLSVIFYGRPRASHDIDFVLEAKEEDVQKVISAFTSLPQKEFIVDPNMIKDAIIYKHIFQILHLPSMLKFDFWLLKDESFDKQRFKRREKKKVFGQEIVFASAEDTILIKLLWYKESDIEKHLVDAAFVYQIQEDELDKRYLAEWTKKHKTTKLLHQLGKIDLEQYY